MSTLQLFLPLIVLASGVVLVLLFARWQDRVDPR